MHGQQCSRRRRADADEAVLGRGSRSQAVVSRRRQVAEDHQPRKVRRDRSLPAAVSSRSQLVALSVVKVERRIRWHYTTTILRLCIGARLTRYRNCQFHNFARTISRHADGISRYSVPLSAGPLLPLGTVHVMHNCICMALI